MFLALSKLNAVTRDQAGKSRLVCCMCFTLHHSGIRYLLRGLPSADSALKVNGINADRRIMLEVIGKCTGLAGHKILLTFGNTEY